MREEEEVQVKPEEADCPRCGSRDLYRYSKAKPRKALHALIDGHKVYLEIHKAGRDGNGKHCGRTFTQESLK